MPKSRNVPSRGAYFLASDSVLDLAIAFLESFRRSNPEIRLCLIPFDHHVSKLLRLRTRYGFEVFNERKTLRICDRFGRTLHGKLIPHYRKLAMWAGPFDEFVYFDIDTVVLESASFVWAFLSCYDFIASQSHIPENTRFAWKKTVYKAGLLTKDQIAYSGSTGFLASRRGALTLDEALSKLPQALALAPHMALDYKEQPFLNYLFVTAKKRRATSLALIAAQNPDLDIPLERWAGARFEKNKRGKARTRSSRVFFIHWAGLWTQGLHKTSPVWNHYRDRGPSLRKRLTGKR